MHFHSFSLLFKFCVSRQIWIQNVVPHIILWFNRYYGHWYTSHVQFGQEGNPPLVWLTVKEWNGCGHTNKAFPQLPRIWLLTIECIYCQMPYSINLKNSRKCGTPSPLKNSKNQGTKAGSISLLQGKFGVNFHCCQKENSFQQLTYIS